MDKPVTVFLEIPTPKKEQPSYLKKSVCQHSLGKSNIVQCDQTSVHICGLHNTAALVQAALRVCCEDSSN